MICQKYTDDCVYFYEDICYMRNDISDEKIATLKKLNDWNLPLDYGKMSSRKFNVTLDLELNTVIDDEYKIVYSKVKDSCTDELGLNNEEIKECFILDEDCKGNYLYFIRSSSKTNNEDKYYFMIVDTSYTLSFMEILELENFDVGLSEFKKSNGWVYD